MTYISDVEKNQYTLQDIVKEANSNNVKSTTSTNDNVISMHKDLLKYCMDQGAEGTPPPIGMSVFKKIQWCIQRLASCRPNLEQVRQVDGVCAIIGAWCSKKTFTYDVGPSYAKNQPLGTSNLFSNLHTTKLLFFCFEKICLHTFYFQLDFILFFLIFDMIYFD